MSFFLSFLFIFSIVLLFSRHFFFFDKTKKMIFNLEGLTVYFPYEYLYPVRFKRVDFYYCYSVTICFVALLFLS